MDELREQCPWDKKQTIESIRHLTIEETYELSDAILKNNMPEIKKELGDILLHIVFYARIASETKAFDIKDVIDGLCEKLIFRHPHIYGDVKAADVKAAVDMLSRRPFVDPAPCPSRHVLSQPFDASTVANGVHTVEVAVFDAAGNRSLSNPAFVHVANGLAPAKA